MAKRAIDAVWIIEKLRKIYFVLLKGNFIYTEPKTATAIAAFVFMVLWF